MKSDLLRRPDFIILAVGGVLLTIGLIIYGARTFQKTEDLPNLLFWAQHASTIGGLLSVVAAPLMRLWGKNKF
jgi:predicted membrane channel-forming protein YqfA (hemolysin III family)